MTVFHVFETVNTVYGPGYISNIRDDCYIVKLINWALAQGQSPTLYLQEDSIRKVSGAFPGTTVATSFGPARIEKIRSDGVHIAKPINWKLANDAVATLYLQPEMVKLAQTPGFEEGDEVMTVYGQGFVHKKRSEQGDFVVKLRNWALAQGQSPTCYLQASALVKIPGLNVGAIARTVWGLVKLQEIRRDGTHVCVGIHWALADGKPPTFYLAPEAFALLSLKP